MLGDEDKGCHTGHRINNRRLSHRDVNVIAIHLHCHFMCSIGVQGAVQGLEFVILVMEVVNDYCSAC
jgi:hypothetical protein